MTGGDGAAQPGAHEAQEPSRGEGDGVCDEGHGDGGRGHYPQSFSVAMAGGGIRGGRVIGATDPDGVACTQRPVVVQELHATICHTLGIDQDKMRFAGRRPVRIVDRFEGAIFEPVRERLRADRGNLRSDRCNKYIYKPPCQRIN